MSTTTSYLKTEDENIVEKLISIKEDISIKQLESEISMLKEEISNLPEIKEKPDQETLDFWNDFALIDDTLVEHITEKEDFLKMLRSLK